MGKKNVLWMGVCSTFFLASCVDQANDDAVSTNKGGDPTTVETAVASNAQALTIDGGIRILSDRDTSFALNAYNGAIDGGSVKLWQDCPKENSDCRWIYRQGMLISATDTDLAITVDPADPTQLILSAACTPDDPDCTWTWSKGQLLSDNATFGAGLQAFLSPPVPSGRPVEATSDCGPGNEANPDCTWTLESAVIRSSADPRLVVYPTGDLSEGGQIGIDYCPEADPQRCSWTFSKGMVSNDADPSLKINAYGGADADVLVKLWDGCTTADTNCMWTVRKDTIASDAPFVGMDGVPDTLTFAVSNGPFIGNRLKLAPIGRWPYPVALMECSLATPSNPACDPGYACIPNDDPIPIGETVNDWCRTECYDGEFNPGCMFIPASPAPVEWSNTPAPKASWTFMILMMGDGDFAFWQLKDLNIFSRVGSTDEVNIIAFADTPNWYDYSRYYGPLYQGGGTYLRINRNASPTVLADLGEVDMTDPAVFSAFMAFVGANFSADHYAIMFWDHGSGWWGVGQDQSATSGPGNLNIPNGDYAEVLNAAKSAFGKNVDIVGYDACLMGAWEVAMASQPSVDYLVASEQILPGDTTYSYEEMLRSLVDDPNMDAPAFGNAMLDSFPHQYVALSLIDLSPLSTLNAAVAALSSSIVQNPSIYGCINVARGAAAYAVDDTRDLYDFADKLAYECLAVKDEAEAVRDAVTPMIPARNETERLDLWGLSIYFPERCNPNIRTSPMYYRCTEPWCEEEGQVWSQETEWDEFLRGFAPPAEDLTPEGLPFAPTNLTAAPGSGTITLSWSPSDTLGVTYTLLRGTEPGYHPDIVASELTDTSYTDTDVAVGETYHYVVIAVGCGESPTSDEVSGGPQCFEDSQCNDDNVCTIDTCNLITGNCEFTPDDDIYEAETMYHSTGNAYADGWNIYSNGYISFNHTFNGGTQQMTVRASGQNADGWPNMTVTVGGTQVYSTYVNPNGWNDYTFSFTAPLGVRQVRINFTNDYYQPPLDRNLFIDKVTVHCNGEGPGPDPGSLVATVVVHDDWGAGYCAHLDITNNGTLPTTDWTVVINSFDSNVNQYWNTPAIFGTGTHTVKWTDSQWNRIINPGTTYSQTGFCALRAAGTSTMPAVVSAQGVY